MNKYLIAILILTLNSSLQASDNMNAYLIQGIVTNIDIERKKIELGGKIYPYSLKFGDFYFESIKKPIKINKLRLNRKYYIEIYYKNYNDFSLKENGVVIYIGKIKPMI